jgi:hypothetical protein
VGVPQLQRKTNPVVWPQAMVGSSFPGCEAVLELNMPPVHKQHGPEELLWATKTLGTVSGCFTQLKPVSASLYFVDELVDGRVLHAAHAKIALHAAHNDDDRTDEVTMHRLLLNTGVVLFCGARKVILKLWQRHSTLKHL